MKLPSKDFKIKVGYLTYDVKYSEDVGEESNSYGSCQSSRQKIFINPKYSKEQQECTFIHEVMHALLELSGLSKRFAYEKKEYMPTEEEVITELSTVFYQFIIDNKEIF